MDKTLGIVQLAAGRQEPEVKFIRRLGGKSLLEWVVRRVTDCQRIEQVVVVLTDAPSQRPLAQCVPPDVPVYFAQHRDALGRTVEALSRFPATSVVRVSVDNPFVDPVLIDRLLITAENHPQCDYISYSSRDGKPAILSPLGIFAEWCSAAALRKAHQQATSLADRAQVTRYLYSHPELFQIRLLPVPDELDRHDVRLRVDVEEDWEHTQAIYDALGADECDWRRIAGLLDHQPRLREQMAALNRAGADG